MDAFDEFAAAEALDPHRAAAARAIIGFMAACGVRLTTVPPQLLELLTAYGFAAIDVGVQLAHSKHTVPAPVDETRAPAGVYSGRGPSDATDERELYSTVDTKTPVFTERARARQGRRGS